ncbi:MAG: hypothetical protein ACYTGZ_20060 [Planctomycetota bacterium]|jgi:hypothetical protein
MRFRILFVWALLGALPAHAQEDAVDTVALRITSVAPSGAVVVDRGKRDGLAVGDRLRFFPRGAPAYGGAVLEVKDRTAIIEIDNPRIVAQPGTRGEARIPKDRFAEEKAPNKPVEPEDDKEEKKTPEHPPWENEDEDWTPDKPLLSEVRPQRPRERPSKLTGRAYLLADISQVLEDDFINSYVRAGTDLIYSNPFRRGGALRVNIEFGYLTEQGDDDLAADLLLRRLAYTWGGDRFSANRWEVGRFLQYGMPEFGALDGAEFDRRRDNGDRYGFSAGWMPEPMDGFASFEDFQIAGFYEWISGPLDELTVRAGFQKTWHDFEPDRDLLVAAARYLPNKEWNIDATFWVDFYTSSDDNKDTAVELSYALVSLRRRFDAGHGFDVTWRHQTFPELDRDEFLPVEPNQLADDRFDRLGLDGWFWFDATKRVHAHVSAFNDEDGSGGAADLGFEWHDLLLDRSRVDITGYGALAQFEDVYGVRINYTKFTRKGSWDLMYDGAVHHLENFQDDRDDLVQHRIRVGGTWFIDETWDVSYYAQATLWDDEVSWSVGFNLQKRF